MKQKNHYDITYDFSSLEELRGIIKACPGWGDEDYLHISRKSLLAIVDKLRKMK